MNATQLVGIIAFGGAALLCFRVHWGLIGTINALLTLECVFGLRHRIHDVAVQMMGSLYGERAGVQITLISIALALLGGSAKLLLRRWHQLPSPVVTATTLLAIALFSIEIVSLHAVDAVVYRHVGGVMVIGWLWLFLGLATATCALCAISRQGVTE